MEHEIWQSHGPYFYDPCREQALGEIAIMSEHASVVDACNRNRDIGAAGMSKRNCHEEC